MKIKKNFKKILTAGLRILNPGTVGIKHPRTGMKFYLDAYLHKGYWFRREKFEAKTIDLIEELISEGETVIEAGAHIGFITHSFSQLVGPSGIVYAFEPGNNNLPYFKKNILNSKFKNILLIEKAVSDRNSVATFYMENYTGQNNSLLPDHIGPGAYNNITNKKMKYTKQVETIALDTFFKNEQISRVDFIKVDIEGAERMALRGMKELLRKFYPTVIFEVTRDHNEIFDELSEMGYLMFDDSKKLLAVINYNGNVLAVHRSKKEKLSLILPDDLSKNYQ